MTNRRNFIRLGAAGTVTALTAFDVKPASLLPFKSQVKLGVAGYSFLHYKDNLDRLIEVMQASAVTRMTLKNFQLPYESSPETAATIISKLNTAGIEVYGLGVIYIKSEKEADQYFQYAANAKVPMIVGSPTYEVLPYVEKKVKETGIRIAIHNHGPEDKLFPDIDSIYEKIKNLDERIGICLDIGHSFRCNHNPSKMLERFAHRVVDMHLKDVTAQIPDGISTGIGRGIIDFTELINTMKKINYQGFCSLEYERPGDPAMGIAESLGYFRGMQRALNA
jgi:inosose dehydratase